MRRPPLALLVLFGCGGQTAIDIPPSSSDFSPPPSDAVPYDSRLGALGDVPGGRARVGSWELEVDTPDGGGDPTSLGLTPFPCDGGTDPAYDLTGWHFGAEVVVAPFRLMTTEVTNGAYALCVDSAACAPPDIPRTQDSLDWRDPKVAKQPVLVSWSLARAFCRHYGGDLPTAGEYARATVGDAETYGQPNMLGKVLRCAATYGSPPEGECTRLDGDAPLADVGTDPNDVGPFGHSDLYGNAWEWTRGYFDEHSAAFCSPALYEHDIPLSFPDPSAIPPNTYPLNAIVYAPADGLGIPAPGELGTVTADGLASMPPRLQSSDGVPFPDLFGFRCAFPTP